MLPSNEPDEPNSNSMAIDTPQVDAMRLSDMAPTLDFDVVAVAMAICLDSTQWRLRLTWVLPID